MAAVDVMIVTPIRLLGESLARCLQAFEDICVAGVMLDCQQLLAGLEQKVPHLVLFDVTQGVDFAQIRAVLECWPDLPLLALGLTEQRHDVINCGRAGFAGYIARDASIAQVHRSLLDAAAGRLHLPTDIAAGLMRALHAGNGAAVLRAAPEEIEDSAELTRRENEVAGCISRGLSNKEIARALNVSVATVKHHVHNILTKLHLPTRSRVARVLAQSTWQAAAASRDIDHEQR
jgi:two-component system, NarL family, nitrate/nitrite response regulator NarL